ncbi:hypothetical protein DDZ13_06970 [Coraliomargarita sinensis]|uniref:SLA1 homology domain-containing protein n=1 Tax=Coraliomargarita sinensis TaxID=2174842 RepID=A0A317ZH58_9BACT|nr:DUF4886 domain-containing protein [Coraliomargarita sinensis]PXA04272.1 hypothetical protein DDZ13_06970 [Coraliomargarita sinensis]
MRPVTFTLLLTLLLPIAHLSADKSEQSYRTWTSLSGSSVEAKLVKRTPNNSVTLKKKNGAVLHVDFQQLSHSDQSYLKKLSALEGRPERILFIGNSYTGQIKGKVTQMVAASVYKDCELSFVHPGGRTLKQHLENEKTMQRIREGGWDVVVLQDQSQTPAIFPEKFMDAAREIDRIIDRSGAETVFYETWGRRDGDKMNFERFPTYEKMQDALSHSYAKAARQYDAKIAPVGQAWAVLRKTSPELGTQLYRGDGSHPSAVGAYLAACVFYATLFDAEFSEVQFDSGLSDDQIKAIHAAVFEVIE